MVSKRHTTLMFGGGYWRARCDKLLESCGSCAVLGGGKQLQAPFRIARFGRTACEPLKDGNRGAIVSVVGRLLQSCQETGPRLVHSLQHQKGSPLCVKYFRNPNRGVLKPI